MIGWTSAEYERPVSLRHRRSWIPARKSRASRIMGERDVRSIAASTSASTEASVPSTIWRTMGSTGGSTVFTSRSMLGGAPREDQVPEAIRLDVLAGIDDRGRAVLLDDDRAVQRVTGFEECALVDRTLDGLLRENDRPRSGQGTGGPPVAGRPLAQLGPGDRPDAGDPQIHPFHRLATGRSALSRPPIAESARPAGGEAPRAARRARGRSRRRRRARSRAGRARA